MAGVLVTSIASGNIITRLGRYRFFPIAGTGIMAIGMFLLSRLEVDVERLVRGRRARSCSGLGSAW